MAIDEKGGKLGGREIEWFKVDDESEPSKGVENASKLVQRDKVDVLIGTVHSGVQMGIQKVVRDSGTLCLIPNAGVHAATRALCAPNVFRTSFTNSQPTLALGKAMVDKGHKKAVWITWKYAAGDEAFEGFRDSYTRAGGTIVKELGLPFPSVEFQALLTEIASLKPDAVCCFFAGAGAAKFIKDYAAAGLKGKIPLYGSGFLTEGVLDAAGPAADGIITTMHYSDSLDTPRNKQFRLAYAKAFRMQPDVYAVQGYDTGLLLAQGAAAVKGDLNNKPALYKAMESATIDSPRGKWTMSKSHNPVQDMYLRVVENKENKVVGVAAKALADSGAGCRMS
jgi:branched-chain amino acid transport system substrate-binding protein